MVGSQHNSWRGMYAYCDTRVAILADVHGNADALEAVLADLAQHGPDLVVFAGDLVMGGPHPVQALTRIQSLYAPAVIGNTDIEVVEGTSPIGQWMAHQLDANALGYLRSLPLMYRVTPPFGQTPKDDLLIVHATPRDCFDVLILEVHPLGTTFNHT